MEKGDTDCDASNEKQPHAVSLDGNGPFEDKDNASSQGNDDDDDVDMLPDEASTLADTEANGLTSHIWTKEEDEALKKSVNSKKGSWKEVAEIVGGGRTVSDCIQRWNKTLRPSIIKGYWTPEEDAALLSLMTTNFVSWKDVSKQIVGRSTKQCRERWSEYLDPSLDHGAFTAEEDAIIAREQAILGNKWKAIAERLGGRRTATSVKVRWNSISRRSKNNWVMYPPASAAPMVFNTAVPALPLYPHPHPSAGFSPPLPISLPVPVSLAMSSETTGIMAPPGFMGSHLYEGPPPPVFMPWVGGLGRGGGTRGVPWYGYSPLDNQAPPPDPYRFMSHGRDVNSSNPTLHSPFSMQQQPLPQQLLLPGSGSAAGSSSSIVTPIETPSYFVPHGWGLGLHPDQEDFLNQTQHVDPQYFQYPMHTMDTSRLRPSTMSFTPAMTMDYSGGRLMSSGMLPMSMSMATHMGMPTSITQQPQQPATSRPGDILNESDSIPQHGKPS